MTKIQNLKLVVSVIGHWNLRFICNLVLVICDFKYRYMSIMYYTTESSSQISNIFRSHRSGDNFDG